MEMKDLREMTAAELVSVTWSDAPAPGGGSIAALAGSLGAALTGMVANLSQGPKYEAIREEMAAIAAEMKDLKDGLLLAMQQDTEAFSLYMAALVMPKNTDEEKAVRREKMQLGLKSAAETPLQVAKSILPVFAMAEKVLSWGNPNAATDALVSAMLARTGMLGALLNVKINLGSIKDEAYVKAMALEVSALEKAALEGEKRVLARSEYSASLC